MSIGNINKNNSDWRNQLMQIADINKKYTQQIKQSPNSISQKTENTIIDSVEISINGRQRERTLKDEMTEMASVHQELMSQLENARKQSEAMAESTKVRMKCLLIAMRIMSGDKVPSEDYRYLAKNDLGLYAKAVSLRMEKENPKKHKQVSKDENPGDKEGATNESSQPARGEMQAATSADSAVNSATPEERLI